MEVGHKIKTKVKLHVNFVFKTGKLDNLAAVRNVTKIVTNVTVDQ